MQERNPLQVKLEWEQHGVLSFKHQRLNDKEIKRINDVHLLVWGETDERKPLSSVSTALLLAAGIGICEALALYLGSGLFLNMMGISAVSNTYFLFL